MAPLILIVEDDLALGTQYQQSLVAAGFRVALAAEASQAIEQARAHSPDLIVMDLSLPGTSGLEATRVLKDDPATRGIPVVALSSYNLRRYATCARAAGCDVFVSKPIGPVQLEDKIRSVLAGDYSRPFAA